jgi:hypothetical protein
MIGWFCEHFIKDKSLHGYWPGSSIMIGFEEGKRLAREHGGWPPPDRKNGASDTQSPTPGPAQGDS